MSDHFHNFSSLISRVSPDLLAILALLPREIKSFEVGDGGMFTLAYDQEYRGVLSHKDASFSLGGSLIKVGELVLGTLDAKCVKFSRGISLEAKLGFLKIELCLEKIKVLDFGMLELTGGKWGQTKTHVLSNKIVASALVEWL